MALGWWLAAAFALASAALAHPAGLRALDGVAVGHRQRVALPGEDRSLEVETLSLRPLLFRVPDFLNATECDHLIGLSKAVGLRDGYTVQSGAQQPARQLKIADPDADGVLSIAGSTR